MLAPRSQSSNRQQHVLGAALGAALGATQELGDRRFAANRPSGRREAFTLTELLVVIALIVLLVSLLLAALSQVQAKSRETSTTVTMQAFTNSCDAFQQEHGFYPGVVPEAILANDPQITGTENALLHLLGGAITEEGATDEEYDEYGGIEVTFDKPNGDPYRVKINRDRMGDGPIIATKPYAPYYAPSEKDFGDVKGQSDPDDDDALLLPDLIDAWGQPILFLRRQRSIGPLTDMGSPTAGVQFAIEPITPYTACPRPLGRLGGDQLTDSIFNTTDHQSALLLRLLEHPALPGQARGAFMMMSAGKDGVYLSREDGAGSPGEPIDNLTDDEGEWAPGYGPKIFQEYDDVIQFGGG